MARTWQDVLRDDPADRSPMTAEEGALMMRVAFLLAADYPQAAQDMMKELGVGNG